MGSQQEAEQLAPTEQDIALAATFLRNAEDDDSASADELAFWEAPVAVNQGNGTGVGRADQGGTGQQQQQQQQGQQEAASAGPGSWPAPTWATNEDGQANDAPAVSHPDLDPAWRIRSDPAQSWLRAREALLHLGGQTQWSTLRGWWDSWGLYRQALEDFPGQDGKAFRGADLEARLYQAWASAILWDSAQDDTLECPICLGPIGEGEGAEWPGRCGHVLHAECLEHMRAPALRLHFRCPVCRATASGPGVHQACRHGGQFACQHCGRRCTHG